MRVLPVLLVALAACTVQPVDGGGDPTSSEPGIDCTPDPSTSAPDVLFDGFPADYVSSHDAWTSEPIHVQAGWSAELSPCLFGGSTAPKISVTITTTGAPAQRTPAGFTDTDPSDGEYGGTYELDDITATAPGALSIAVATTDLDTSDGGTISGAFTVRTLDDIQIGCVLGADQSQTLQACGSSVAPGTAFTIELVGISAGARFTIEPRLAWTGATPIDCGYAGDGMEECTFPSGATQDLSLSATFAGVTRAYALAVQ